MITAPLVVLTALLAQAQPTAASLTLETVDRCRAVRMGRAEAEPTRFVDLDGGLQAMVRIAQPHCGLQIEGYREAGEGYATAVRDGLQARTRHWRATQWRERQVSELGPSLGTTLVFSDAERHRAHWVRVIEPADGGVGPLSVSFGVGP